MSIFENMGIEYEEKDGILYPLLSVDDDSEALKSVGKYGLMWMEFMKTEYPDRYRHLVRFGKIKKIANDVNEQANELSDVLQEKYLRKHKNQLSGTFMERVRLRNQARMMAEEIVFNELVNKYH